MPMCGGLSDLKEADPKIQEICDSIKASAEEKAGKSFAVFAARNYKTQVVAGTNYFIKVHVGGEAHAHLRVFKSLPHAGEEVQLHGIQHPKSVEDEIVHF
ncbi:cystatin-B-like [Plectropomus leopardus]|uniref:cystatin-B-like n=1 Tax=Plectropomus leopardus TaxID=160734 RepID=UPI001C4D9F40|nr:cystatin-B-like [Plectropomus leopardus]